MEMEVCWNAARESCVGRSRGRQRTGGKVAWLERALWELGKRRVRIERTKRSPLRSVTPPWGRDAGEGGVLVGDWRVKRVIGV